MRSHDYIPRKVKIMEKNALTEKVVGLRLKFLDKKPFDFHPGQFVMLSVSGFGEIPIGITTSPKEKGFFEVAVSSVGMVSQKICSLSVGDTLGVSGPFGNGFYLPAIKGKDVVMISGGFGLAPLRSLIHHIARTKGVVKSLTILSGAKTPKNLLYRDEYEEWEKFASVNLTVDICDSNWKQCKGMITKLFDLVNIKAGSVMLVCGPPMMYESVIKRFAGKRISDHDLYFLLERRMKCGIGKCQHCTCGKLYVCIDGPVFSYEKIKYNNEAFK